MSVARHDDVIIIVKGRHVPGYKAPFTALVEAEGGTAETAGVATTAGGGLTGERKTTSQVAKSAITSAPSRKSGQLCFSIGVEGLEFRAFRCLVLERDICKRVGVHMQVRGCPMKRSFKGLGQGIRIGGLGSGEYTSYTYAKMWMERRVRKAMRPRPRYCGDP